MAHTEINNYRDLYLVQDSVMDVVFGSENVFYLTGGTCLSRFYCPRRYSDDLDFFCDGHSRFHFALKNIIDDLKRKHSVKLLVESKDFLRLYIDDILQIDFVNDHTPRFGDVVVNEKGYVLDNVGNIMSNKISAVIGRDNPKDVFDLYLIDRYFDLSWSEALESAHKKTCFTDEEFLVRLNSFPVSEMNLIQIIEPVFLDEAIRGIPLMTEKVKKTILCAE